MKEERGKTEKGIYHPPQSVLMVISLDEKLKDYLALVLTLTPPAPNPQPLTPNP